MTRLRLMNTEIDNLTMDETLDAIDSLIKEDNCSYVVTPNVDHIVQLEKDEELKRVYENASLILFGFLTGIKHQLKRKFLAQIYFLVYVI